MRRTGGEPLAQLQLVDPGERIDLLIEKVRRRLLARHALAGRHVDVVGLHRGRGGGGRLLPARHLRGIAEQGRGARDRARRRGKHERPHARRIRQREVECAPTAHRLCHDAHVAWAEVVDERRNVARIVDGIGAVGERARRRKAAMRERHAGVAVAEVRHLLPPAQVVATESVREHQHRARACNLVVDATSGTIEIAASHWTARVTKTHI
jgi:hypothetical protein